jgi:hypothetical protein
MIDPPEEHVGEIKEVTWDKKCMREILVVRINKLYVLIHL